MKTKIINPISKRKIKTNIKDIDVVIKVGYDKDNNLVVDSTNLYYLLKCFGLIKK